MCKGSVQLSAKHNIDKYGGKNVAVLIPCYNEEVTIKKVINDFQQQLPMAAIYVYDNNSSDNTSDIARAEGAIVVREKRQGKGFVVASMFEDIDADVYVLVDGDDTYPADSVHELTLPIIEERADMVVGTRLTAFSDKSFRPFHIFGNRLVVKLVNMIFKSKLTDIMSGYRAFNMDFIRKIPIISRGFEVETQMTLQALYYDFVIIEVPVSYRERPEGSYSKLNETDLENIRHIQGVSSPAVFFHYWIRFSCHRSIDRQCAGHRICGNRENLSFSFCHSCLRYHNHFCDLYCYRYNS